MDNASGWNEVDPHIVRHDSGCWTWDGSPVEGNVYRVVAKAYGAPLPTEKLYRMPDCTLGKECVNPNHLGTAADFVLAINGRRQEIPEPSRAVTVVRLTKQDREFLRSVKVGWD
jgi:hypothetical protein